MYLYIYIALLDIDRLDVYYTLMDGHKQYS